MGCQVWLAPAWWFLPGVTEGPVTAKPKQGLDLWPGRQQPGNPSDMLYIGGGGVEKAVENVSGAEAK